MKPPRLSASALNIALLLAATLQASDVASQIESQGGRVVRDSQGRITEVSMAGTWATDADIDPLPTIPALRALDLSLTYVSDRGAERLARLDQLEDLNLFAAEFITDAALSHLRNNKKLRRLNLRGTDITDTSLEYIAALTSLRSLDISFTQISDVGMEHLVSLAQLEELNVGGNKISGVGLHVLKLLPKLRKLSFNGIQRRNAGYCWAPVVTDRELDAIALLAGLEHLDLGVGVGLGAPRPASAGSAPGESECRIIGGIKITDLGLNRLATLKNLRTLDLSGSAVTTPGLKRLTGLPKLERLSLWNAAALDPSAAAHLAAHPNLSSLDLSNTAVNDDSLRQLANAARLKRLYLTDTRVTAAAVEAFRKQRPDCQVFWAQRPSKGIAR